MNSVHVVVCHALWDAVECVDEKYAYACPTAVCLIGGCLSLGSLSGNMMNEMRSLMQPLILSRKAMYVGATV